MDQKTTRSLSKILEQTKDPLTAEQFIVDHREKEFTYFYEYLNQILAEKRLVTTEVIRASGISRNYVYNILNGNKKNPGRDKIIALCVGAEMSYNETQRALELAKVSPLYPKDERDVRIAIAINNRIGSVTRLNLMLEEHHLEPLDI